MSPRIVASGTPARPAVDVRAALHTVGRLCTWFSATLIVPGAVAIWYGESIAPFAATLAIGLAIGLATAWATRGADEIGVREGFLVVALAWLAVAAIGLPALRVRGRRHLATPGRLLRGHVGIHDDGRVPDGGHREPRARDPVLALPDPVARRHGHHRAGPRDPAPALGGRARADGERGSGTGLRQARTADPRHRDRLWALYVWFTLAEIALLCAVGYGGLSDGMDLYMAVTHSFTTLATGGFSPDGRSLELFGAWSQWIVIAFMAIAGVNFGLWWRAIFRHHRALWRDHELHLYLGLLLGVSALVAAEQYLGDSYGLHGSIRHAVFQVMSMMTTTGFASVDYVGWPQLSLFLLVAVMFVGGCSGSTSGSIKVIRVQIVARALRREVRATLHPEAVMPIRGSRQAVPEQAVRAALVFTLLYLVVFLLGVVVLLVDAAIRSPEIGAFDLMAAAACTIGNVGPGLGFAGPMGSFAPFGDVSTITMTILMWTGRLELLPVLVLLSRWYWRR